MSVEPRPSFPSIFALLAGMFFLLEGTWGLFSPVVFGMLTTNPLHAGVHIVLGVFGLMLGLRGTTRDYLLILGALLICVGLLRFLPPASVWMEELLNVNSNVAVLNLVLGAVSLSVGMFGAHRVEPAFAAGE